MTLKGIVKAENEARRFLEAAEEVHDEARNQALSHFLSGTKKTGALRRASQDLSRVLSEMRKP